MITREGLESAARALMALNPEKYQQVTLHGVAAVDGFAMLGASIERQGMIGNAGEPRALFTASLDVEGVRFTAQYSRPLRLAADEQVQP